MSCNGSTPNLYPVGITYDSRNRPTGLAELSSVIVSSLSSTGTIKTNSIVGLSSTTVTFLGPISATAYLGAGGGAGVTSFIELSDVESGTVSLDPSHRGYLIAVNENGNLTTSSVSSVNNEAGYINASSISSTYETIATVGAIESRVTILEGATTYFSSLPDVSTTSQSNGDVVVWNSSVSRWVNLASSVLVGGGGATTFLGLTDTPSTYTGASSYFVKVNSAGTAVEFSSDPGYIQTSIADSRYLNSSGDYCSGTLSAINLSSTSILAINIDATEIIADNLTVNSTANKLLFADNSNSVVGIPLDGDFSLGSTPAANSFLGLDSLGTTVVSYPKFDYVLSSANVVLSSTVSNHIASAGIHFYASSLSSNPGYALSSWTDTRYSLASHNHTFDSLANVLITSLLEDDQIKWDGSKWINFIPPADPPLGGLADVNTVGASQNNSLIFNGVSWVASPIDHGVLSGLSDNDHPQYALSSWTETQYLNSSGDSANAGFFLSSLSSANISATTISAVSSFVQTSGFYINGNRVPYKPPVEVLYLGSGTSIATTANVTTALFSATIPANTMRAGDALKVEAWGQIVVSAVTGVATNSSAFVLYGNTSALDSKADVYWMNNIAAIASGGSTARTLHWDVNVFAQTSAYQVLYGEVEYAAGAFGGTKGEGAATATSNLQGLFKHTNGANPTKNLSQDQQILIGWVWVASPGAAGHCKLDIVTMTVIRNPSNY